MLFCLASRFFRQSQNSPIWWRNQEWDTLFLWLRLPHKCQAHVVKGLKTFQKKNDLPIKKITVCSLFLFSTKVGFSKKKMVSNEKQTLNFEPTHNIFHEDGTMSLLDFLHLVVHTVISNTAIWPHHLWVWWQLASKAGVSRGRRHGNPPFSFLDNTVWNVHWDSRLLQCSSRRNQTNGWPLLHGKWAFRSVFCSMFVDEQAIDQLTVVWLLNLKRGLSTSTILKRAWVHTAAVHLILQMHVVAEYTWIYGTQEYFSKLPTSPYLAAGQSTLGQWTTTWLLTPHLDSAEHLFHNGRFFLWAHCTLPSKEK